jgi:hypothetical protein
MRPPMVASRVIKGNSTIYPPTRTTVGRGNGYRAGPGGNRRLRRTVQAKRSKCAVAL